MDYASSSRSCKRAREEEAFEERFEEALEELHEVALLEVGRAQLRGLLPHCF